VGKLDGVKSVQNLLQVVPEAVRPTLKVADDAIKTNLEASLKAEPVLGDVKVASVNNGVALLSGKTQTLATRVKPPNREVRSK
jgi:osmotically-inducible protein OsmY